MYKKVYLIGAGPGSADLITARGLNILRQADVIIYDYLVDKRLLEQAKATAQIICCDKLGKKRFSDGFLKAQDRINAVLAKKAKEGKRVVRLKNGDAGIFSRISQELAALVKNKIEFEIVPGVTSASAASSFSGVPLTDRKFASSCTFVTGHEGPSKKQSSLDWNSLARNGTIVLYMAVENLEKIAKRLINAGKNPDTAAAIIQNAGLLTQNIATGTLKDISKKARLQNIRPPAIVIIGDAVKLEKKFNWLRKNRRILFTGLSDERFFLNGTYFHMPLIKIEPLKDYLEFDGYLKDIGSFNWIIFASRYGVEYFFKRLSAIGCDARALGGIKIAAVGNSTKNRLLDFGIKPDLVPEKESSAGLLEGLRREKLSGKRLFMPRSDLSDKGLEAGLKKLGAEVVSSFAYRNTMPSGLPDLDLESFDEIMFTSPSGVRNFIKRYSKPPKKVKISCTGAVTAKEAKRWRLI